MDLASDEFRLKIDKLAAQARKMQQVYASSGARILRNMPVAELICSPLATGASGVMDQTAIVNPAGKPQRLVSTEAIVWKRSESKHWDHRFGAREALRRARERFG